MSTSNYDTTTVRPPTLLPQWLANVVSTDAGGGLVDDGLRAAAGAGRPDHDTILRAYRDHHRDLLRFAALVAPEDSQPEDLVQDAFVRLYRSWAKVTDHDRLGGYLRITVLNLARGRGRRLGVARRNRGDAPPDEVSAEHHALGRMVRSDVVAALRALSRRQRECLVLRYFEGYTESEIADALGISVGSARTHVHRGTETLRTSLGGVR